MEVRAVPDDAAGVHAQRSQHQHAVLVEHRHHQQHVPVAQAGQVDEGDPHAALVLGVPAHGQHVLAADVLGVGGVGRGGDALRPPALVAAVLPVEGEAPVDGPAEPPPAEQEGTPGLAVEVGQHRVDADPAAEQRGEGVDLADVLVGPAQVHPDGWSLVHDRSTYCHVRAASPCRRRRRDRARRSGARLPPYGARRRPRAAGSSRAARSSRARRRRRRWCGRYARSSASRWRSRTGWRREAPITDGLVLRVAVATLVDGEPAAGRARRRPLAGRRRARRRRLARPRPPVPGRDRVRAHRWLRRAARPVPKPRG